MNKAELLVAKLAAKSKGKAVCIRETSLLSPDPDNLGAICCIKVATEEQVQALAYGNLTSTPNLLARLNPMSRDVIDILPFAHWLNSFIENSIGKDEKFRIWLPHNSALECIAILGARYASNTEAPPEVQKMGQICKMLAEETRYAGQQAVVIGTDMLQAHFITGQTATEDQHLGALLAWINPVVGEKPEDIARSRARKSLSCLLVNTPDLPLDNNVEAARRELKNGSKNEQKVAEFNIKNILKSSVLREWKFLVEAVHAMKNVPLQEHNWSSAWEATVKRFSYWYNFGIYIPKKPHTLAQNLEELETALSLYESEELLIDSTIRSTAIDKGVVLNGELVQINQPNKNRNPCSLFVKTNQRVLKVRVDDKLTSPCKKIEVVVKKLDQAKGSKETIVELAVSKGVRSIGNLEQKEEYFWLPLVQDFSFSKRKAYKTARSQGSWVLDMEKPPSSPAVADISIDLLSLAKSVGK